MGGGRRDIQAMFNAPLRETAGDGERKYVTARDRTVAAPAAFVWAILSDTNRWDRAVGLPPSTYSYEEVAPGLRLRVGETTMRGFFLRWIEVGEWIEGRSLWGERRFTHGLLPRGGFRVVLTEADGGEQTHVHVE